MGATFAVLMVIGLAIALGAYWFLARVSADEPMGFLDYVRNPGASDDFEAEIAARDQAVAELAKLPPEELVAMLREDADQFGMPARAIEVAGPRVVPALLAAVGDPRFRGGIQKGAFDFPLEPLEEVLSSLGHYAPPEAVAVVTPLLDDESDAIRGRVASLLGAIATDEAAEPLVRLLQDEDDYVRSAAMRGILAAHKEGRISDSFRKRPFDAIVPLAFRRAKSGGDDAPVCLLVLDRERAIMHLTDPAKVKADQENIRYVLRALRDQNVPVDESLLLAILDDSDGTAEKHPASNLVGETLLTLAKIGSDKAAQVIEQHKDHPSKRVRKYAAEAQAMLAGLDNPIGHLWDKVDANGWGTLTVPQQHVLAVNMLIGEVNNGGFLQYFVNPSGEHWQVALAGLQAIGADQDAALFAEVLGQFGDDSPSTDQTARHTQAAKIAENDDRPFEQWERQFYKDHDGREALLMQYMMKHKEDLGG